MVDYFDYGILWWLPQETNIPPQEAWPQIRNSSSNLQWTSGAMTPLSSGPQVTGINMTGGLAD